ncbi:larval cuticle protein 4-like [Cochliomyia hominivorax]
MFKFMVVCALLATASAQRHGHHGFGVARGGSSISKSSDDVHAEIIHSDSDVRPDGFNYHLETTNGISAKASGDAYGNVQGDFQWISPEGEHVAVNYVADENGYQPSSDILPTPHPIPDAILKALDYIASHPPKEEGHQQYYHHGRKF